MRNLIIFICFCTFIGCVSEDRDENISSGADDRRSVDLKLIDSLGTFTLSIPNRYDTNFNWVHYSDCGKPCDEQKYRFQSKLLPIKMESGWLWSEEQKDSVDRLTISHKMFLPFHNGDSTLNLGMHGHLRGQFLTNLVNVPLVIDTIQKINGRYFSIFAVENSDSTQSKKVLAVTTIKSNEIKFLFELSKSRKDSIDDNFIKKSVETIKTIRLSQGI